MKKVNVLFTLLLVIAFLSLAIMPVLAAPTDLVRVWVTYQSDRKAEVFQALNRASASFHYDFPQLNAYVVSLPSAALNGILRNPFVVGVESDPERTPIEPVKLNLESFTDTLDVNGQTIPWGIDVVQARDVWDENRDAEIDAGAPSGEGITVCIIDTGYYADHDDLKDVADGVTGMSQVDDNYLRDGYGHGTHVAGTISALNNGLGVVGVTPGTVDFHIVKIFDDAGAWVSKARASDLTAAIYSCQANGANVISMSLSGTNSSRKEQQAFDELYAAGILHIAAASNDHVEGEEIDPYHYPASYESVVSVAAVDSSLEIADFSQRNDAVEIAAPGVNVLSTLPYIETNSVSINGDNYEVNHVEYAAYGEASGTLVDGELCTSTGDWEGMIVLCSRGEISFLDKVMNVQNSGGRAAIIYNNVENEDLYATLGEGTSEIVAVSTYMETGQDLLTKVGYSATVSSSLEKPASGYEAWAGTSMATPHVSGVAALIWSANPTWTNVQIREAMTKTAMELGEPGRDIAFGYGLVQAADALVYLEGMEPQEDQLVVTITSPDYAQQFADKDTVLITVSVTDGTTAVEGASVSVTVTSVNLNAKTFTGTTDANGSLSFTYRINARRTGFGQYAIDVTATKEGYLAGIVSSIFTVK